MRKKLSAMEEAGWEDQERLELRLAKVEAAVGRVQEASLSFTLEGWVPTRWTSRR